MSPERDVTPIVRSWLEVGPTALPDRVLDDVLDRLPATPQRRPPWYTRRSTLFSSPIRIAVAAVVIGLFAVIGINVLPRGGDGIGTDAPSPSLAPSPATSPATTLSLDPPADVDAYVMQAYDGLVELPALTVTVVEEEGTKARYMYNGAGVVHHDHFSNATNDQPAEYRIFSRDVMAERSDLNGEPVWLENTGQGHPLRELSGGLGLQTYCETAWGYVGLEYLIDRPTHHVSCGESEMWLDVETRLPLRSIRVQADGYVSRFDTTELQVGPQPANLFQPPAGLRVVTSAEFECASDPACQSPTPEETDRPVITPAPAPGDFAAPADLEAFVADVLSNHASPPALEMLVDEYGFLQRIRSDGSGRYWSGADSGPGADEPDGVLVTDGHVYEPVEQEGGSIAWSDHGPHVGNEIPDLGLSQVCRSGWEHHGFDLVLDRPAHHLVCGYLEFWIDRDWMLVTRYQRNPGPLEYDTDVSEVIEMTLGQQPAELFQLPPDAVVYDEACFQRGRLTCEPGPSGPPAGAGPALTWSRVDQDDVANIAWLGDRVVLEAADGSVRRSMDGVTWESLDADDPDSGYADVMGSKVTATWADAMVGWDATSVRTLRPPGTPVTKSDFKGPVGAVGIGPAGIVARVHSGIDFDAFVTGFLGPDWVGQISEFEFADGVLHIATEDGRSADIVMADHGLGPGDVADRGYGWFSADGATWTLIPDFPSNVSDIVGVADGFLARGESMWHSPDGMTWTEIGPYTEGSMLGWHDGALIADPSGRLDLWTAAGPRTLPVPGTLSGAVGVGPLGMVSVGTASVLFSDDGREWSMRPLPEGMYAAGGGRRPPQIAVSDNAVLVVMWSGGETPVPTLWLGTPDS